jgi:hypothetical protein
MRAYLGNKVVCFPISIYLQPESLDIVNNIDLFDTRKVGYQKEEEMSEGKRDH